MTVELETQLGQLPGATPLERRSDGLWMVAPALDVQAMAGMMRQTQARLVTITAVALEAGETAIIYHYMAGRVAVNFRTETRNRTAASIVPFTGAANWIEREIHDLYAVEFAGHPNLTRLIRPPGLPQGFFRAPEGTADVG
jgi:NADH:ubiquinone oxidoreductase subunit C